LWNWVCLLEASLRILIAGDLHFDKKHYGLIFEQIRHCDCLCLTGDYLDDRIGNFAEQVNWVSGWVKSISKPIFMCSGNHDLDELAECEWLYKLTSRNVKIDDQIYTFQGVKFGVAPYIGADFARFSECDVLVTHLPPKGTKTARQNGHDFGDDAVYSAVKSGIISPGYILCGHVEQPEANHAILLDTKIINPGTLRESDSSGYQVLVIP
jgi:Icc-related predicted phosphoesterase